MNDVIKRLEALEAEMGELRSNKAADPPGRCRGCDGAGMMHIVYSEDQLTPAWSAECQGCGTRFYNNSPEHNNPAGALREWNTG